MKNVGTILKVLAALAAIIGIVYVAAAYGDRIVTWARNLLSKFRRNEFHCFYDEDMECCEDEDFADDAQADEVSF